MSLDREQVVDADWEAAEVRSDVFRRVLTVNDTRERSRMIARAMAELSVSRATFYRLLARFRATEVTSAVLPGQSGRRKGSRFLDTRREAIIAREISRFYLRPERPRLRQLVEHIHARCHHLGLPLPDWRTIRARVRQVDAAVVARRRRDRTAIAATQAVPGELATDRPLEIVQIDHTKIDVIVAEATSRMAMARPWLTLAIDVRTRMVVGAYLALHEPSAVSVGVCLLNAVFPKQEFLQARALDLPWPTMGLPAAILVDNGADFRSRAFIRGCREHGIRLDWRPPGTPRVWCMDRCVVGWGRMTPGPFPVTVRGCCRAVQSQCRAPSSHPQAAAPGDQFSCLRCGPATARQPDALTAIATSVARRRSVRDRSPSPMTRLKRLMSASTRARQL